VLVKAEPERHVDGHHRTLIAQARAAGYATIVSARLPGETEDTFMADPRRRHWARARSRSGRCAPRATVSKYNQLLRIEEACSAPYAGVAALAGRKSRWNELDDFLTRSGLVAGRQPGGSGRR